MSKWEEMGKMKKAVILYSILLLVRGLEDLEFIFKLIIFLLWEYLEDI